MGLVQTHQNWIVSINSLLPDCKSQKQLLDKIIFIESLKTDRSHLGVDTVDIFRLKEAPYQSFLKNQRTFPYESPKLAEFSSTMKKLCQTLVHKNLAPVHFVQIHDENNMCMRSVKIEYYATYFGIQLRDIIESRKSQDWRFTQGEILYVAKSLINLGAYLQKNSIAFGHFKSKNLFLSDNGYIKLYLFHLLPQNKHINYFHTLSLKSHALSLSLPIAPQTFKELHENNINPTFDYYKADVFEVGMVLIEMIMEGSLQRYYRYSKDGMVFDVQKIKKDMQELSDKQVYDEKVIVLLQKMLETNPKDRWSFQQCDLYLDNIKKSIQFEYRLNLRSQLEDQEQQQALRNKISFKSQQPESQYVLRSIQMNLQSKLNPLPLKSLSKLQPQSNQPTVHRSIYTKRRNTGVSIISSSSYQNSNNRSFSKKQEKSSKFTTVRNSRILESQVNTAKPSLSSQRKVQKESNILKQFDANVYSSQTFKELNKTQHDYPQKNQDKQKISDNWMTLGSTRITEENSKTFSFLPPKGNKSTKNNPKLLIHHKSKQNMEPSLKKDCNSISTHIKIHKKNILSPKSKDSKELIQLKASFVQSKVQSKENIPDHNLQPQSLQKQIKTVRPKMKINHHFRA